MNRKQAEEKGYRNTGIYVRDKETAKLRKKVDFTRVGYKAIVVVIPDSKYSRGGGGTGYSVYAEQKYFDDLQITYLREHLQDIPRRKAAATEEYVRAIELIKIDALDYQRELNRLSTVVK